MRSHILLVFCVAILCVPVVSGQRCGDDIWFYVRDTRMKVVPLGSFTSVKVRWNDESEISLGEKNLKEVPKGIRSFTIPTWCGLRSPEITITVAGRKMVLNVHNVMGDSGNVLLDSVPFREGTFEIDLRGFDRKNCEFDHSIEEPAGELGGSPMCVIRPARWKRSNTKPGSKADLVAVLKAPAAARAGDDIAERVSVTARNAGTLTAPLASQMDDLTTSAKRGYQIDLVLSTDKRAPIRFGDAYVTSFNEDMLLTGGRIVHDIMDLLPGSSKEYRLEAAKIPEFVPPGDYYLCAVIDPGRTVTESNENNNVSCVKIKINP